MRRELNDEEYQDILLYVQSSGINEPKQQAEMADHLAVVTELHLNSGMEFDRAFRLAKKELAPRELDEIKKNSFSFSNYPRFLGRRFLTGLAILSLTVFLVGFFMKQHHLPHHRIWIIIGRRSFVFLLLPLWLLHNLTEYANKTRQVLTFIVLFTLAQTIFEGLIKQKLNRVLIATTLVLSTIWIILFIIHPYIKRKQSSGK